MDKQLTVRNSQSIDRDLMATDTDGNAVQMVMVNGRVQPGKSLNLSINIVKPDIAKDYADDIKGWIDGFIAEIRALAAQSGMPV